MNEAQALQRLQEIDLSLIRLRAEVHKRPEVKRLEAIPLARKKIERDRISITGQRKDAELELKDNEDMQQRLKKREDELKEEANQNGHTHRQIQVLEEQLSNLAKRREKLAFTHKPLQENLEKLLDAEENSGELVERLEAEEITLKKSFTDATQEITGKTKDLVEERTRVLTHLLRRCSRSMRRPTSTSRAWRSRPCTGTDPLSAACRCSPPTMRISRR